MNHPNHNLYFVLDAENDCPLDVDDNGCCSSGTGGFLGPCIYWDREGRAKMEKEDKRK